MLNHHEFVKITLLVVTLVWSLFACSGEEEPVAKAQPDLNYDEINPQEWGISNGCIQVNRIESFTYVNPQTAKLDLTGNKSVILTFKNKCSGFEHRGVVYTTRTGRLCARFDHVKVLEYGTVCLIESIEPFLPVDEAEPVEEE